MKALKSALAAVIAIVICLSCGAPLSASAATARFAYADLGSEVYFCTEKNAESAIFIIPQTYCVEILAKRTYGTTSNTRRTTGITAPNTGTVLKPS